VKYPWVVIMIFALAIGFFSYQLPKLYIDTDVTNLTTGSEGEILRWEIHCIWS